MIRGVNDFMPTGCSEEVMREIAEATTFSNMKNGKAKLTEHVHQIIQKVRL